MHSFYWVGLVHDASSLVLGQDNQLFDRKTVTQWIISADLLDMRLGLSRAYEVGFVIAELPDARRLEWNRVFKLFSHVCAKFKAKLHLFEFFR